MKTAVSLPDPLFEAAKRLASQLGISADELIQKAMEKFLRDHDEQRITDALDRVYSEEQSSVEPELTKLQAISIDREDW